MRPSNSLSSRGLSRALVTAFGISAALATAQVPDGHYLFGSFQGAAGANGLYFAHPRDPLAAWIEVQGLPAALAYDPAGRCGAACVAHRDSDGMVFAGERAPIGTSVDVHMLRLSGNNVVFAQLFSVGTSANVGEIPQMSLLPDGRVVLAATDLQAGGPLAHFQTSQYNWEGIGILDPVSGGITPVTIPNLNQFPGVINCLTVSNDGSTIFVGNYISTVSGDVWAVPIAGGNATQIATLPSGASAMAVDLDGSVLVGTLNGPPNLFRIEPQAPYTVTVIPTTTGPLNAIAIETVTGNYAVATANAGTPARSLLWMEPNGTSHLLQSPNLATIAGIAINHNPSRYGAGVSGASDYGWELAPNPGGLPLLGSAFSLTMRADPFEALATYFMVGLQSLTGVQALGLPILVDPSSVIQADFVLTAGGNVTRALPIPLDPNLQGLELNAQMLVFEFSTSAYAASPGVEFTIL